MLIELRSDLEIAIITYGLWFIWLSKLFYPLQCDLVAVLLLLLFPVYELKMFVNAADDSNNDLETTKLHVAESYLYV